MVSQLYKVLAQSSPQDKVTSPHHVSPSSVGIIAASILSGRPPDPLWCNAPTTVIAIVGVTLDVGGSPRVAGGARGTALLLTAATVSAVWGRSRALPRPWRMLPASTKTGQRQGHRIAGGMPSVAS